MKLPKLLFSVSLLLPGLIPALAQPVLTNGLVAHYAFNGNATDETGHGFNGTVRGAVPTTDRFGVPNRAFYFNGTNSMINVPESLFGPSDPAWTISIWVKTDGGPHPETQGIFLRSSVNGGMGFGIISNQAFFGVHLSQPLTTYQFFVPIELNKLTHCTCIYRRGQSISLYLDGKLSGSLPVPDQDLTVDPFFPLNSAIGAYDYVPSPYMWFKGTLDDMRVYLKALSPEEVQQLFMAEAPAIINVRKATYLDSTNLQVGMKYQIQVSEDLTNWSNHGIPFSATNSVWRSTDYWSADEASTQFFRLQMVP